MNRLIVADDDPSIRELIRGVAESVGFSYQEAADGLDAINCIEYFKPDVVLVDLSMPKLNGIQLIETIQRENGQDVPRIIVISGHQPLVEEVQDKLEVDRIILKPVKVDVLKSILKGYFKEDAPVEVHPRILIIDEVGTHRMVLKKTLLKNGFRVLEVEDGKEGLLALQNHRDISLIVFDVPMPNKDVAAVIREMRVKDRQLPIIVITDKTQGMWLEEVKENGVAAWIVKPVTEKQIEAAVTLALPQL